MATLAVVPATPDVLMEAHLPVELVYHNPLSTSQEYNPSKGPPTQDNASHSLMWVFDGWLCTGLTSTHIASSSSGLT